MCYNIPMESFKQYIYEGNKGLTIFDIDDTMFKTKAKVLVRNKNTTVITFLEITYAKRKTYVVFGAGNDCLASFQN